MFRALFCPSRLRQSFTLSVLLYQIKSLQRDLLVHNIYYFKFNVPFRQQREQEEKKRKCCHMSVLESLFPKNFSTYYLHCYPYSYLKQTISLLSSFLISLIENINRQIELQNVWKIGAYDYVVHIITFYVKCNSHVN